MSTSVQIWPLRLDESALPLAAHEQRLDDAERARAARFRFEVDRRRFVIRRSMIRAILATVLGTAPAAVRFDTNEFGKPVLADVCDLRFNASVRHDRAVLACSDHEVGIDLEPVRGQDGDDELARQFFSDVEVDALTRYGPVGSDPWSAAFFRCWTRKEAYLKGIGTGLSVELGSFDVEVSDVAEPALLASRQRAGDVGRWKLVDLGDLFDAHCAALACDSPHDPVKITVQPHIEQ